LTVKSCFMALCSWLQLQDFTSSLSFCFMNLLRYWQKGVCLIRSEQVASATDWARAVVSCSKSLPGSAEEQERDIPITITDVASAVSNTSECSPGPELAQSALWLGYGLDDRRVCSNSIANKRFYILQNFVLGPTHRAAEIGFGSEWKTFCPPPPPARAKILYIKSETWLSVAEWLGLCLKGLICTIDK
jgi:hypothetical protein